MGQATNQGTNQVIGWEFYLTFASPLAFINERFDINIEDARQRYLAIILGLKQFSASSEIGKSANFWATGTNTNLAPGQLFQP